MPHTSRGLLSTSKIYRIYTKFFIFAALFIFAYLYFLNLVQYGVTEKETYYPTDTLIQEALNNVAKDFRYADVYRKKARLPKNLKFILLWTPSDWSPFYYYKTGQRAFIEHNCSQTNCYVTSDRNFFDGDVSRFDVVAFNGRNLNGFSDLPAQRHPQQKYIFFNSESNDNCPICDPKFDDFFNWTATYKLGSDIVLPYFNVKDKAGNVVAPKTNVTWLDKMESNDDEKLFNLFLNKTKAVAWFVSNCHSRSGREAVVEKLRVELLKYGRDVYVYGECGPLKCPRHHNLDCMQMLEKDFFFYLSFENSFAEDYVTEKVLTALNLPVIPIVYGGANYSRFLPPSSYLSANLLNIHDLALAMNDIMLNFHKFRQYFLWKPYYKLQLSKGNECGLCDKIHDKSFHEISSYPKLRYWWNPNYKKRCPKY